MRCAWREVATYVDAWYSPVFFGSIVASIVLFLWGWRLLVVFGTNLWWWQFGWTLADHRRFRQWLRDTDRKRYVAAVRLVYAAMVFLFIWPIVSPTFCENVKCAGYKGLKPRTECLPQGASGKYPGKRWQRNADARPGTSAAEYQLRQLESIVARQFEAGGPQRLPAGLH